MGRSSIRPSCRGCRPRHPRFTYRYVGGGGGRGVRNLFLFSAFSVLSVVKMSFVSWVFRCWCEGARHVGWGGAWVGGEGVGSECRRTQRVRNLFLFSAGSVLSVVKLSLLALVFVFLREVALFAGRRNFVGPAGVPGRRGGCGFGPVQRAWGPQSEPSRFVRLWCAPCGAARDAKHALAHGRTRALGRAEPPDDRGVKAGSPQRHEVHKERQGSQCASAGFFICDVRLAGQHHGCFSASL